MSDVIIVSYIITNDVIVSYNDIIVSYNDIIVSYNDIIVSLMTSLLVISLLMMVCHC